MVMNSRPLHLEGATSETRVRTLVVDDSPTMLTLLTGILKRAGHFDLVGTATDGWRALREASVLSPELVLMDIQLPHLNGIQATQCIKDFEHPPVVIIVTSDDSPFARSMAEQAGADGFIVKAEDLNLRLPRLLQDLFGPSSPGRVAAPADQDHGI
jgi:DNA-binding NarL/FixJ family response regulator